MTRSRIVQPQTAQPGTVQPQTVQPQTVQPQTVQPQTAQPRNLQPRNAQPQTEQPGPQTRMATGWVEASPFRAHVRFLMASADVPGEVVAALADVQPRVLRRLLTGAGQRPMRRLSPLVAFRLYVVTPGLLRQCQIAEVPAAPVSVTLGRLLQSGWSLDSLAELLRTEVSTVTDLLLGRLDVCPQLLAVRAGAVPLLHTVQHGSAPALLHAA